MERHEAKWQHCLYTIAPDQDHELPKHNRGLFVSIIVGLFRVNYTLIVLVPGPAICDRILTISIGVVMLHWAKPVIAPANNSLGNETAPDSSASISRN